VSARPFPQGHRDSGSTTARVARVQALTRVLGPGARRALWVQGCALRCAGCVVPESHPRDGGAAVSSEQLAHALLDGPDVDGVTFSGGEPFLQAAALAATVRLLRAERPEWTYLSYSGYRLEAMRSRGSAHQRELLAELDVLIDGPFVRRLAGSHLWRGSANQRIVGLTARGRREIAGLPDRSAGIEIELDEAGRPSWTGIPPDGFREQVDAALARRGRVAEHEIAPGIAPNTTRRTAA
jgi:anaerobic ribonucleoside-triphosphate reductase activating protein